MKHPSLVLPVFIAASVMLCSYAQTRRVAFDEAAFAGYGGSGSATISGTAFTILRDKSTVTGDHNTVVKLAPDNDYTEEIANRHFENRVKLEPADPRFSKYVRRTHPDDGGHFTFGHLPAGKYIVSCHVKWSFPSSYVDSDGTAWPETVDDNQWIYARVSVKAGQTLRIEDWAQGAGPLFLVGHS
jgi:hypothetical protein